jgi:hypothetical protein
MLNEAILPAIGRGASVTGQMQMEEIAELQKALTVGYGTDVSTFSGGTAFRIQSLDKTMMATIQENKHFRLFNELAKSNATATVDEWTEMSQVGGFPGGSTNSETGNINAAQGTYNRRVGFVKYLMTRREVSFVSTLGNNIVSAEAIEAQAGAKQLLTDAEYLSFEGNSAIVPTEFDGIFAQIAAGVATGAVDPANIIDARGQTLASINFVNQAAAQVSAFNNFGQPTHLFCSQLTQADFDTNLDPAFRVPLTDVNGGGLQLGSPVKGIRTSWGDVANMPDVFIRDSNQQIAFELLYPAVAAAQASIAPSIAPTAAVASNTASNFTGIAVGHYYYFVTGINAAGQSIGVATADVNVGSGQGVTLTITRSAGAQETGYVIYRSNVNPANGAWTTFLNSGVRYMDRVAVAGATTTYLDLNNNIPGTTNAYILNMTPGDMAISWRQLLPMLKFPLYPTAAATIPWAQLLFGYLRITKRRHHAIIKNVLPNGAAFRPFNV